MYRQTQLHALMYLKQGLCRFVVDWIVRKSSVERLKVALLFWRVLGVLLFIHVSFLPRSASICPIRNFRVFSFQSVLPLIFLLAITVNVHEHLVQFHAFPWACLRLCCSPVQQKSRRPVAEDFQAASILANECQCQKLHVAVVDWNSPVAARTRWRN